MDSRGDYEKQYEEYQPLNEGTYSSDYQVRDEVFSKVIRAGKRTYFFDVKSTRGGELFLNITESRKKISRDNRLHYEKHTLFLYKEDFEKFSEGLKEVLSFINAENSGNYDHSVHYSDQNQNDKDKDSYNSQVKFEELGSES
jgi:hypothetical protein